MPGTTSKAPFHKIWISCSKMPFGVFLLLRGQYQPNQFDTKQGSCHGLLLLEKVGLQLVKFRFWNERLVGGMIFSALTIIIV